MRIVIVKFNPGKTCPGIAEQNGTLSCGRAQVRKCWRWVRLGNRVNQTLSAHILGEPGSKIRFIGERREEHLAGVSHGLRSNMAGFDAILRRVSVTG